MFPIPRIASRRYGLFALCAVAAVATNGVFADSFKLYINKDQNAANVITFDDSLTAAVKHTSEGMELVLPGVEVALRCKSNGANSTTDSCVIAVEAATVSSTATSTTSSSGSSSGTTSTTSTSSGTSSGDCTTQGTWSNCDSTSSSGSTSSTGSTSTTTTTTSTTTNSAGSSSCTSASTVLCRSEDIGSGGSASTGNTIRVNVDVGQVVVFPFTVEPGRYQGSIGRSRTSSEVGSGQPRLWFSLEPNGKAICSAAQPASYYGASDWTQVDGGSGCPLGNTKGVYYFNVAVCDAPLSDRTCQSAGAKPSNQLNSLYIVSRKYKI